MFEFSTWLRNTFKRSYHGFNLTSWLKQTFGKGPGGRTGTIYARPASARARLQVEALEDRTAPAVTVVITPVATPTATFNDFTVIQNALSAASSGDTIDLQGTFHWNETFASASYVNSVNASD